MVIFPRLPWCAVTPSPLQSHRQHRLYCRSEKTRRRESSPCAQGTIAVPNWPGYPSPSGPSASLMHTGALG